MHKSSVNWTTELIIKVWHESSIILQYTIIVIIANLSNYQFATLLRNMKLIVSTIMIQHVC